MDLEGIMLSEISQRKENLMVKNLPTDSGDVGPIPVSGRSPAEGYGNPFQYSCLGYPMDRETWRATIHGVAKESDMT